MLAVLLSADTILMSHAPPNLPNLLPAKPAASPQPVEKPAAEREGGKDENGFLRSDSRGEIRDNKVECLGCSTGDKNVFPHGCELVLESSCSASAHATPDRGS